MMLQLMFTVWGVLIAGFTALMVYRGHLTQHETDELFLSETADQFREQEHDALLRRVRQLRPLVTGFGGAAALMTVAILGTIVVQALPYVRF